MKCDVVGAYYSLLVSRSHLSFLHKQLGETVTRIISVCEILVFPHLNALIFLICVES